MGLDVHDYMDLFDRANLCNGKWSMRVARVTADILQAKHDVLVLCGAKVATAFGLDFDAFTIKRKYTSVYADLYLDRPHRELVFVILPHPSGRSRLWNAPDSIDRARKLLAEAGVLTGPGTCGKVG